MSEQEAEKTEGKKPASTFQISATVTGLIVIGVGVSYVVCDYIANLPGVEPNFATWFIDSCVIWTCLCIGLGIWHSRSSK